MFVSKCPAVVKCYEWGIEFQYEMPCFHIFVQTRESTGNAVNWLSLARGLELHLKP